jgi:chromate reductase, NAD(P)H dehydrogenase (quinone)
MITIISSTNRDGSNSSHIAKHYYNLLKNNTLEEVSLVDLKDIPLSWYENNGFKKENQHPELRKIQEQYMIPAEKFVFVIPEYNGSFPGVLKLFIDACSINMMTETFKIGTKKAMLVGVASGRAGNLRGLDQFTGVLNYLNVSVLPNRLPISTVGKLIDADGNVTDEGTKLAVQAQVESFLLY